MVVEIEGKNTAAKIETLGAELTSFRREDGFELLWQGDPKYWEGQAPVLFPVVGALRGGRVRIKGEWYSMPSHGFARRMEFEITKKTRESVTMTVCSNEETRKLYPYEFRFSVTYTVVERGLETKFRVENPGSEPLPFVVGGHPAYNIPAGEGECFEDYEIRFSSPETQSCPEVDLRECLINFERKTLELKEQQAIPLQHSLFYGDALIFENLRSRTVSLISRRSGRGVEMDVSDFPMLGIWSAANDGPYVALEPWVGCATTTQEDDELLHKKNMVLLPAGGEKSYAFTTRYL